MMCCHISTWSVTHSNWMQESQHIFQRTNKTSQTDTTETPASGHRANKLYLHWPAGYLGSLHFFPVEYGFLGSHKFNACIKSPIIEHQTGTARILASCLLKDRKKGSEIWRFSASEVYSLQETCVNRLSESLDQGQAMSNHCLRGAGCAMHALLLWSNVASRHNWVQSLQNKWCLVELLMSVKCDC